MIGKFFGGLRIVSLYRSCDFLDIGCPYDTQNHNVLGSLFALRALTDARVKAISARSSSTVSYSVGKSISHDELPLGHPPLVSHHWTLAITLEKLTGGKTEFGMAQHLQHMEFFTQLGVRLLGRSDAAGADGVVMGKAYHSHKEHRTVSIPEGGKKCAGYSQRSVRLPGDLAAWQ